MADRETEVAVYRLLSVPGLGAAAATRVVRAWQQNPSLIDSFWVQRPSDYTRHWGLSEKAARFLASEGDASETRAPAESAAARARDAGIELLTLLDSGYDLLAAARGLPAVLFTRGNQDLVGATGVALVHSRDASETALMWGAAVAAALAAEGMALVSGHNRDGYCRVAAAAKRAGSPLTIALDRPLHDTPDEGPRAEPVSTARLWDPAFRPERQLLVSGSWPGDVWTVRQARARDALVVGLARVIVAGDVRPGGIIASLLAAAGSSGRPVLRSPFCRADLGAPLVPFEIPAAAAVIRGAVNAVVSSEGPVSPKTGWLERRWEQEIEAFVAALRADSGPALRLERLEARPILVEESHERPIRHEAVRVVVHLPSVTAHEDGEVVVITGVAADPSPSALLLAPREPVRTLSELRGYLTRCRARAREALKTPQSAASSGPDPFHSPGRSTSRR
jgi:DNA recombination-mediator protein A